METIPSFPGWTRYLEIFSPILTPLEFLALVVRVQVDLLDSLAQTLERPPSMPPIRSSTLAGRTRDFSLSKRPSVLAKDSSADWRERVWSTLSWAILVVADIEHWSDDICIVRNKLSYNLSLPSYIFHLFSHFLVDVTHIFIHIITIARDKDTICTHTYEEIFPVILKVYQKESDQKFRTLDYNLIISGHFRQI